ncbi:PadR-like family transcriptional regulator [Paenibacillus alvei TS-15]|jgi:PadR family transcriptional regulator, regulatory protein PadR|uniref:PadR-like family transcriptional regulator n=2 Tax=Paenibacillus alvei TaxID=44250 RepID=S9TXQ5_PAEAL|nr:PadR family transcriptional regulator [Paenibacillus alvei]EPY06991.1 PadR-like family transcriptional regulator [Paenibacillus alvei TS-15]SYX83219.1 PadR-like family transcriptional regulator [Paenibacillus alvei]
MADVQETIVGLLSELRRGTIVIGVLSQLSEPQYGYSLVSLLEEKGIPVDPGTLYPLLRRLEKQELLESRWDTNESRPRKYYQLSPFGKEVYAGLNQEWRKLVASMEGILSDLGGGE